jgi:hypothetical protein
LLSQRKIKVWENALHTLHSCTNRTRMLQTGRAYPAHSPAQRPKTTLHTPKKFPFVIIKRKQNPLSNWTKTVLGYIKSR